ncbi:MAG: hypothetical protein N3E51_00060 [Candidatus Micrarchaeota archaeon]|nr:hypothetical protein [Candidatus Micrarchaeota archaeon]
MDELERRLRQALGEKYEKALSAKISMFGGLLTKEAAIRLLCKENGIDAEQKLGLGQALKSTLPFSFAAKIDRIFPVQKYRNGAGCLVRLHISDETGSAVLVLWNEQAALVQGKIAAGDTVECSGAYVKGGEIHIGRGGSIRKIQSAPLRSVSQLSAGLCNVVGVVGEIEPDYAYIDKKSGRQRKMSSFLLCESAGKKECRRVVIWSAPEGTPGIFEGDYLLLENVLFKNGELHFNFGSRMVVLSSPSEFCGRVESFLAKGDSVEMRVGKRDFLLDESSALRLLGIRAVEGAKPSTLLSIKGGYLVGKKVKIRLENDFPAELSLEKG